MRKYRICGSRSANIQSFNIGAAATPTSSS
jgi:hypothetical protein